MIRALTAELDRWREDASVHEVMISSSLAKAFCVGGDVKAVRQLVVEGDVDQADAFFGEEYDLIRLIAEYPKPCIAMVDGYAFGAGMGLGVHCAYTVCTETSSFSMPEAQIGFVVDVGSSYYLTRLRGDKSGAIGRMLALCGYRLRAHEAHRLGLVDAVVPNGSTSEVINAIGRHGVARWLSEHDSAAITGDAKPGLDGSRVVDVFDGSSLEELMASVQDPTSELETKVRDGLASSSPTSLSLIDLLLAEARGLSVAECIDREYAAAKWCLRRSDFVEGVGAVLVDRGREPGWQPAAFEGVDVSEAMRVQS